MTPIDCLREVREATAGEIAAVTGTPIEDVYAAFLKAQTAGIVSLRQTFARGRKPLFTWVVLGN